MKLNNQRAVKKKIKDNKRELNVSSYLRKIYKKKSFKMTYKAVTATNLF